MVKVHPAVYLDYRHNCSVVHSPDGKEFACCLTEQAEAEVFESLGYHENFRISDEQFCEWAYFWLDRS